MSAPECESKFLLLCPFPGPGGRGQEQSGAPAGVPMSGRLHPSGPWEAWHPASALTPAMASSPWGEMGDLVSPTSMGPHLWSEPVFLTSLSPDHRTTQNLSCVGVRPAESPQGTPQQSHSGPPLPAGPWSRHREPGHRWALASSCPGLPTRGTPQTDRAARDCRNPLCGHRRGAEGQGAESGSGRRGGAGPGPRGVVPSTSCRTEGPGAAVPVLPEWMVVPPALGRRDVVRPGAGAAARGAGAGSRGLQSPSEQRKEKIPMGFPEAPSRV